MTPGTDAVQAVVLTDIEMPLRQMVAIMIEWYVAALLAGAIVGLPIAAVAYVLLSA